MFSVAMLMLAAVGPGLGNVTWSSDQLFTPVSFIESPEGHGNVAMVQGYLMVIYSSDGGGSATDGGIEFWDVSDPAAPALVVRHDDDRTHGLREAHGFSLGWHNDRLILAAQGIEGVQLWDVTEPLAIELLSYLDLDGIQDGDYSGDWWVFWQAPWLYVAGVNNGLTIVNATDPAAPVVAAHVPTGDLAGVSPSQVFAIGNLLLLAEAQGGSFVTLDISQPDAPRVLRRLDGDSGYSHVLAADGKIYTSGNIPPRVAVHQLTHNGGISHVSTFAFYFNSGGYGSVQDGFFHSGFSDQYIKFDVNARSEIGSGSSGRADRDEDFALVIGNLVFAGEDHGSGTALYPHQAAPDTNAPVVQWMHPAPDATGVALTSRIGLSFSDLIDPSSMSADTVRIEDDAGARVPAQLSVQLGVVNISPLAPLDRNRTYRVVAENVKDYAGNLSPRFESTITTGDGSVGLDPNDVVPSVDSNSPFGDYTVLTFSEGALPYADRDFTFLAGYPARFEGQPYIQTRNNDKLGVSADFLRINLAIAADVVVLYDATTGSAPDWLDAFTLTGETVTSSDTTFDVYTKRFQPGTATLGGNNASGASGVGSMYSVLIVPERLECALELAPSLEGNVTLSVAAPSDAIFDWQIGDQVLANAGATPSVELAAGRHSVVVTVTREPQVATCSGVQIVHLPLAAEPARSSSPILFRDNRAITVNPDNGTVAAVDATRVWETEVGTKPVSIALDSARNVWVVDRDEATVTVLDGASGSAAVMPPLPRASRPEAIVIDPDDNVYISLSALGEVVKLDTSGNIVLREFIAPTASGLTFFEGKLYVSRFISPDEGGEVYIVDADTLDVDSIITLANDEGPDTEATGRGVLSQLSPLRIAADGTRGYVSGTKANIMRGLFRDNRALTFESRVRAFVAVIDMATHEEILSQRRDINDRDLVQATLLSPFGDLIFVASANNMVDVFETRTGRRVSQFHVEKTPQGLALNDNTLAVQNFMSRSVSFFDVESLLSGRGNQVTSLGVVVSAASEKLSPEVLRGKRIFYDASDRRVNKDGYISCASCHLDGGHDGRTWDFTQAGEGLRNTVTLHGRAGTGHGNVHWTANFDEIQDFENDIRNAFGGTGLLSNEDWELTQDPLGTPKAGRSEDLDALAAFVTSLDEVPASPYRQQDGSLTQSARRGREVFLANECATCHSGRHFTDLQRHDVGTIGAGSGLGINAPLAGIGFDTPTLKGLWQTPPYFHDGSALTLDDVLDLHAPDVTDPAKRADLVAYLMQLDETSLAPEDPCGIECVIVDDPNDPDPNDPNDPPLDKINPVAPSCGCDASPSSSPSPANVALWIALLFLVGRGLAPRRGFLRERS